MSNLKPCPFCGKEVELFSLMYGRYCIRCMDCHIGTDFSEFAEILVEKWNRRAENENK